MVVEPKCRKEESSILTPVFELYILLSYCEKKNTCLLWTEIEAYFENYNKIMPDGIFGDINANK